VDLRNTTVLGFGLGSVRVRVRFRVWVGVGLGLVGIMNFRISGPS